MRLRLFSGAVVLLCVAPAFHAARQSEPQPGISGRVLSHDGSAVTAGSVTLLMSITGRVDAAIDRRGQFRVVPDGTGPRQLFISVPGHAPYRAIVHVPSSRAMALPDIMLSDATYFRARFATADGEQLAASALKLRSIDSDEGSILDPFGHLQQRGELDGTLTIGPLPAGRTLMAFDRPGYAQTRLRDVNVNGKQDLIDGGTITIAPGAQLNVDVVDAKGQAVPRHDVWLQDASQPSPLSFPMVRTNEEGRAVFDRLAAGRYRVSTQTPERCGPQHLTVSRLANVGSSGASRLRLVAGGRVAVRITSVVGPMSGRSVSLSPDAPGEPPWRLRIVDSMARRNMPIPAGSPQACGAITDNDGRITLTPFPPGPAIVKVRMFNSTYVTRATVPEGSGEIAIAVPDGMIPVRVINRANQSPLSAQIVWSAGGGRVEAGTTANGDALIEGAGAAGGTMTISAREFQTLEGAFAETPDTQQEIALLPAPSARLTVRVVNEAGDAVGAIVQLLPRGAADAPEFTAADPKGVAVFINVPAGPLQFSAHAAGFKTAAIRVAEEDRASITITLIRAQ
jgi:hypothetical protein